MTGERVKNKTMFIRAVTAMLITALVFVAAACGGGGGGSSSDGPSITVSSKKFTEQILLGEMYAQAFEDEGYNVERKLDLGSEQVMDKSLQDGTIDVYPEYTGTAYVAILKKPPESYPKSAEETYRQVAKFYKNRKDTPMQMLEPAPFENNYGIVMLSKEANERGIENLDDLAAQSDELVFSSYSEFQNRSDGYKNMQDSYPELDFKDIKIVNDLGIRYKALAEGEADVGIGFTTDGQLASPELKVIEDNKDIWPKYYPAPVITQEFLDKNPDAKKILNEVSASLDADKMRELNGAVDLEQEDPEDVAQGHLEDAGIIE
ncbi:glycine betaine ABC transporter substrate-binding protein [Rubrobacter tropicus]|uniref:glycine betaine ABC transporter substrate-binding protein n=1 Tax=Rubrobacter tropicus TaxID=2653851 RepID=UPI001D1879B9|nr:glycine betaine ABC transporter substrate-binding protein [Rubrobacter tropicus]